MKFTIVTPTLNHSEFIELTLRSVLNQSHTNYEYIVMDGGSTDGSQKLVSKYSPFISKFISEKDEGQADAINKGFSFASDDTEIYGYLNSDDLYFEDTLKRVASFFNSNPEIDVVYGDTVFMDRDMEFLRYFRFVEPFNLRRLSDETCFISQPSTFWRKRVFEKLEGFDTSMHYGFDWDFWVRAANSGFAFKYLPVPLSVNLDYPETKTASGGFKRMNELLRITSKNMSGITPYALFRLGYRDLNTIKDQDQREFFKGLFEIMISKSPNKPDTPISDIKMYGTGHCDGDVETTSIFHIPILKKYDFINFNIKCKGSEPNKTIEIAVFNDKKALFKTTFQSISAVQHLTFKIFQPWFLNSKKHLNLRFEISNSHLVKVTGIQLLGSSRVQPFKVIVHTHTDKTEFLTITPFDSIEYVTIPVTGARQIEINSLENREIKVKEAFYMDADGKRIIIENVLLPPSSNYFFIDINSNIQPQSLFLKLEIFK